MNTDLKVNDICFLLDMDGVLVDFHRVAVKELGFDYDKRYPSLVSWEIYTNLGLDKESFYSWLNNVGTSFWANLPFTKFGNSLLAICNALGATYLCTAPTLDNYSAPGKLMWVRSNFGKYFDKIVISKHKYLAAKPNHILIDDADKNVEAFTAAGGNAILYPRPWNKAGYMTEEDGFALVLDKINRTVKKLRG